MIKVIHFYASELNGVAEGGIASYVRELLKHSHTGVLHSLVGVTRAMGHPIGQWGQVSFEGNKAPFYPVFSVDHNHVTYEKGIPLNARFLWALFWHRSNLQKTADILHFHRVELALPFVLFKKKGVPVVLTIHGTNKHYGMAKTHKLINKGWFNSLYSMIESFVISRVDKVILVSTEGMEYYSGLFPKRDNLFKFFPTFADFSLFCQKDRLVARKHFGFPAEWRIFLFVGRLHEQKGLELLLDAFILRKKNGADGILVIAGDGGDRPALQEKVESSGLSKDVLFLGNMAHDSLPALLSAADVFVLSSRWEGMPIVLLEALACGLPVVSTDVGQVPMVIKDGVNGQLVYKRDSEEMAAAFAKVMDDSVALSTNCRESAKMFSSEYVIKDIENLYASLLRIDSI